MKIVHSMTFESVELLDQYICELQEFRKTVPPLEFTSNLSGISFKISSDELVPPFYGAVDSDKKWGS